MENLKDRLKGIIAEKGTSISKLEISLNLPNAFISKYIKGDKSDLGQKTLEKIIKLYPDINPTWLLTGEGQMVLGEEKPEKQPISLLLSTAEILPMKALAGDLITEFLHPKEKEVVLVPHLSFRAMFIIEVDGDSMEPVIRKGELLIVTHVFPNEIEDNKIYIIHTRDGETLVKRLIADQERRAFMLISENRKYKNQMALEAEVMNFFKVISRYTPVE